jgi:hypothetical protein
MLHTPARRFTAGATAAALLAGALLIPPAIAVADEIPEAVNEAVAVTPANGADAGELATVQEPADETLVPAEPAVGEAPDDVDASPAATDEPTEPTEPTEPENAASADEPASAERQSVPTAASTDDPQDPEGQLAPGETIEIPYIVTGAKVVYVYATSDDLDVWVVRPDGFRLELAANGVNHSGEYYWLGNPDGTWTLQLTNTGSTSITPEYGISYSTPNGSLELVSSVYAPALSLSVTPIIDGSTRTDLTVHSQITAADGTVDEKELLQRVAGSTQYSTSYTGLPDGRYFVRVWTVVDGVTYQATRTVGVHAAETEPPTVALSTNPVNPNAAGWFRNSVLLTFTGSDSGSGYAYTTYTIDAGPERSAGTGISVPITADGEHTVRFRAKDNQGNFSDWQESTIRVDATAPTISLHGIVDGARYAVGEELFVEYQCGDATSGLDGENCTADRPDGARVDTTTPGDYTFTIQARDLAGNTTRIVRSYSVGEPDTTDPVVDIELPAVPESGWFTTSVTAYLTATDESGVARIHWEIDTDEGTFVREVHYHAAYAVIDVTGANTLRYWAEDAAGNRSEEQHVELSLDLVAPEIAVSSPQGALSILPNGHYAQNERVAVDFDCTDVGSGIASCEATTPDGELLPTGTAGTHELRIVATDVAGLRTERVVTYTVDAAPAQGGGGTDGGVVRPGATGGLAATGAQDVVPALALAALLLGAGAVLVIRRRVRTR